LGKLRFGSAQRSPNVRFAEGIGPESVDFTSDISAVDRYLAEFDFRQNTRAALGIDDATRAETALEGIRGKRLTYRRPHAA
jgi:hypothetical protein